MTDPRPLVAYRQSRIAMDTSVTIEVVHASEEAPPAAAVETALGWFAEVERRCSRFDPDSELARLCASPGVEVPVSPLLFTAIQFARMVAEATDGAFDPTVGATLARAGFNRDYATGEEQPAPAAAGGDWRDVVLDEAARTVRLARPLLLDLGAVAKGMAVDLAAEALRGSRGVAVDAGGDLYLGGESEDGPWLVGIAHPRRPGELLTRVRVRDLAVCTSGDYERRSAAAHHILDARRGTAVEAIASVTVIAPGAMVADALGTAAFALGPDAGVAFLEEQPGIEGMLVLGAMTALTTSGWAHYVA